MRIKIFIFIVITLHVVVSYAQDTDSTQNERLFLSIENNDFEAAKKLIEEGADVNYVHTYISDTTVVDYAKYAKNRSKQRALLGVFGVFNPVVWTTMPKMPKKSTGYDTIVHYDSISLFERVLYVADSIPGKKAFIHYLLNEPVNLSDVLTEKVNLLSYTLLRDDFELLQKLYKSGLKLNQYREVQISRRYSRSIFSILAEKNKFEAIDTLMSYGVYPNRSEQEKLVLEASYYGHYQRMEEYRVKGYPFNHPKILEQWHNKIQVNNTIENHLDSLLAYGLVFPSEIKYCWSVSDVLYDSDSLRYIFLKERGFNPLICLGMIDKKYPEYYDKEFVYFISKGGNYSILESIVNKEEREYISKLLLQIAIEHNDETMVKSLCRNRTLDRVDSESLSIAFEQENTSMIKVLFELDRRYHYQQSVDYFYYYCRVYNNPIILQYLWGNGHKPTDFYASCISAKNFAIMSYALELGIPLDTLLVHDNLQKLKNDKIYNFYYHYVMTFLNTPKTTPYQEDGKWGFKEQDKIIVSPQYDTVSFFDINTAIATLNGKQGVINRSGEVIAPIEYDTIHRYIYYSSYGKDKMYKYSIVKKEGLYGVIDHEGKTLKRCKHKVLKHSGKFWDRRLIAQKEEREEYTLTLRFKSKFNYKK